LSAFIPFTVTSESVRTYLGISIDELEDHEIDLLQAYHTLVLGVEAGGVGALGFKLSR